MENFQYLFLGNAQIFTSKYNEVQSISDFADNKYSTSLENEMALNAKIFIMS